MTTCRKWWPTTTWYGTWTPAKPWETPALYAPTKRERLQRTEWWLYRATSPVNSHPLWFTCCFGIFYPMCFTYRVILYIVWVIFKSFLKKIKKSSDLWRVDLVGMATKPASSGRAHMNWRSVYISILFEWRCDIRRRSKFRLAVIWKVDHFACLANRSSFRVKCKTDSFYSFSMLCAAGSHLYFLKNTPSEQTSTYITHLIVTS